MRVPLTAWEKRPDGTIVELTPLEKLPDGSVRDMTLWQNYDHATNPVDPGDPAEVFKAAPAGWVLKDRIGFESAAVFEASGTGPYVTRLHNSAFDNAGIAGTDVNSTIGQRPNVRDNVEIVDDASASDGKALAIWARWGEYPVPTTGDDPYSFDHDPSGKRTGPTMSRGWIYRNKAKQGWGYPLQFRVRARNPYAGSGSGYKVALMWWSWPDNRWLVELDWLETFGEAYQKWTIAHHIDIDGDNRAPGDEQRVFAMTDVDMHEWHTMDVLIHEGSTKYYVDGVLRFTVPRSISGTGGANWYPPDRYPPGGAFTYGRRVMKERRLITGDAVDLWLIDYIEVWQPA